MFDLKHIDTTLALIDIKNSGTKLKQMICDRKVIPDYYISYKGDIFSNKRKTLLLMTPSLTRHKHATYPSVNISINGKRVSKMVHRLVCETYNPIPLPSFLSSDEWNIVKSILPEHIFTKLFDELSHPKNLQVNHIDHDTTNYAPENLEWLLGHENIKKAVEFYRNKI